jgi:histidine triad (HIT) family protein
MIAIMQRTVFNDIVEGKLSCYKVYEDDQFLAFLDVFPRAKGHTLVIPKTHYRWTYDVPNFGEYLEVTRKVALQVKQALDAKWVNFFTHGAIPYAHFHILPRYEEISSEQAVVPEIHRMSKEELAAVHQEIMNGITKQ